MTRVVTVMVIAAGAAYLAWFTWHGSRASRVPGGPRERERMREIRRRAGHYHDQEEGHD